MKAGFSLTQPRVILLTERSFNTATASLNHSIDIKRPRSYSKSPHNSPTSPPDQPVNNTTKMLRMSGFAKLAASAKNALSSRDAASTQANLETINAAVVKLIDIIEKYTGGLLAASSISSQQAQLGVDIKNAIADTKASQPVTDEESKAIMAYIAETLEPNIKKNMSALKEKKSEFAAASLQSTVLGDMKELRDATNQLGEEMVKKAPAAQQGEAKKLNETVDDNFKEAIQFFS